MEPTDPVTVLFGVGPQIAARLEKLSIQTLADLLEYWPRRYEDWTNPRPIASLRLHDVACLQARVRWIKTERSPRRRLPITKALLEDDSGEMLAIWFNQPYLAQTLRVGKAYYWRGKVGYDQTAALKQLINPLFEQTAQIYAVYPETAGLSSKQLRYFVRLALPVSLSLIDPIPKDVAKQETLIERVQAFRTLHQPIDLTSLGKAQERFAFEELFLFFLQLHQLRHALAIEHSPPLALGTKELQAFTASLPFTLTQGQRTVAWQIIQDLKKNRPMNRVIQGDVGSGKTVVAAFAAYVAVKAGYQVAWLAPTELLAEQHLRTITSLFAPFGITVGLATRSHKAVASAIPSLMIGTHALLNLIDDLPRLALLIVDEQHRFGVEQRAALRHSRPLDGQKSAPHFLSMTATPIPRTLALTLFGDLHLSVIPDRPVGRQPIVTRVVSPEKRAAAYQFIHREVMRGRQVFVVCPVIEELESGLTLFAELEKRSVLKTYHHLRTEIFPDLRLGLIHGRLKPKDKQATMAAFVSHQLDIVVATAVIEVGIDVPNATVMVIESADRFGLAQLHQLRGRVGRGNHQSYCLLFSQTWNETTARRLKELERTADGFELAEIDLRLRGPGQFMGTAQSGFPEFKLANLMDFPLMQRARAAAERVAEKPLSVELQSLIDTKVDLNHLE